MPPRFADKIHTLCKVPTYLRPLTQASRCVILGKNAFERTLSGPFSKPFTAAFQLPRLSVSSYPAFISASSVWGYSVIKEIIALFSIFVKRKEVFFCALSILKTYQPRRTMVMSQLPVPPFKAAEWPSGV